MNYCKSPTSPNRIVNASPPVGRLGLRSARSVATLAPTPHSASLRHSLPAPALLRKPLYGLANRRLQPGTLGEITIDKFF